MGDPYWKKDERDSLKMVGHVQQTRINALLTKSDLFQVKGVKRGAERPRTAWLKRAK